MTTTEIAKQYIEYLEKGDMDQLIKLFSKKGQVTSPIYGTKLASDFYAELKEDTFNSKLKLKGIFEKEASNEIAIHFNYKWILKNKSKVEFDVVDILEFDTNKKINHLQIIYDTLKSRVLVNTLKQKN
jgi:predicted transposase YbfD/YdcC